MFDENSIFEGNPQKPMKFVEERQCQRIVKTTKVQEQMKKSVEHSQQMNLN